MRVEQICKNCRHISQNTGFTKFGGKPLGKNVCTLAGGRLVTDPPRVVNPETPCELAFDLFKKPKPPPTECPYCREDLEGNYDDSGLICPECSYEYKFKIQEN